MKITNYLIDSMVYASILGKSLFLAFGKGFLGFCKIFTPVLISIFLRIKSVLIMSIIIHNSEHHHQSNKSSASSAKAAMLLVKIG